MSIIRQDPVTKEWVIIATARAARPHDLLKAGAPHRELEGRQTQCPFCPGNEGRTPPELLRLPGDEATEWGVRVVSNKFAALDLEGEPQRREEGFLFREMDGVGAHEVVIETPLHNRTIARMASSEVERVLLAYRARYQALRQDPRIRYITIFKNHGVAAGTSLPHPHSQIVATPIAPMRVRRKYEVAISHFDDTGRCLYCDLVAEEQRIKSRVVEETDQFVVFHPFASRLPFETWIAPKHHQPSFGLASGEELAELAQVLQRCLFTLSQVLGDPDFNYILHTAPIEDETKPYFLWHLEILPRMTTIAGFELGSGISITTIAPEESAASVRAIQRQVT